MEIFKSVTADDIIGPEDPSSPHAQQAPMVEEIESSNDEEEEEEDSVEEEVQGEGRQEHNADEIALDQEGEEEGSPKHLN